MDRTNIIGIVLIFILFLVWAQMNESSTKKIKQNQNKEQSDTSSTSNIQGDSIKEVTQGNTATAGESIKDSINPPNQAIQEQKFGVFAPAASGTSDTVFLENELIKIGFSTKGGFIVSAIIKNYEQWSSANRKENVREVLQMMNSSKNKFYYTLPIQGAFEGQVKTSELYFTPILQGNTLTLQAKTTGGGYFQQQYKLSDDGYHLDYAIEIKDLDDVWKNGQNEVELYWENWLNRLEVNTTFEKTYSTLYYRPTAENPDYCSCRDDDLINVEDKNIKWFSHANQFFNTSLVAKTSFENGIFSTRMLPDEEQQLKITTAKVQVPIHPGTQNFEMSLYVGPNEFDRLRVYGEYLEDIIPYGSSIFGSINRWIIRPVFEFLKTWVASAGLIILLLTLIVKLVLSPLTHKMLVNQTKMSSLKPEMDQMRAKFKDDPQQQQVETMKLYREFGVNPLGGCLPMVIQMPIWFALYRFFPAAIDFRQKSFLWASDLSSYDIIAYLPFSIPFYGDHVSLFTLLWAATTIAYTYYNSKMMDVSSVNPAMKYLQYIMPIMFIFVFNSFAAGLSCYLLFSNVLNVGQILVTKNFILDPLKIRAELEKNKNKPKKKSGFGLKLEEAMKMQQELRKQKQNNAKK